MNVKGVVNYSSLRLAIVVYFALMGASLVHQSKSRASVVASQLNAISTLKKINITNNLRVIQHAWHFWFGLSLVFTVVKLSVVVACFTP
ncbi:hypothetical protein FORC6_1769 [Vibrio parahaemolyticus]|nr:hypothetical protein FORC6_1769 [Vibrio parahaemolyticus]